MSYRITFESMINELKTQSPGLAEQIVDYYPSGQMEAVVKLRDGSRFRYDYRMKTMSRLPSRSMICDQMTEAEWRAAFAERLRRRMFMKGFTQSELADMTGIHQVSISNYLNGRATPSGYNIERLSWALECPASELVNVRFA
jgi:ribosome-binding protein aMBF1 (putative translation factor)